jgi:hypothetical protein
MAGVLSLKTPSTGLVTLTPTDTATDKTITLPATTGTVVIQDGTSTATVVNLTATGTVNVGGGNISPQTGFKNRIINGAMTIDQRNAGASVATTVVGTSTYTVDRWAYVVAQASKFTVQQNAGAVTPPVGFTNYLGTTSTSAYSSLSSDYFGLIHVVEGFNAADLGWGTANASTITCSFWVRSSLTGTFSGSFRNEAVNRYYVFSYTISAANTWEYKTITIVGDTSGTWVKTNSIGIRIWFDLGSGSGFVGTVGSWQASSAVTATGSTSIVGTSGATFYITGVQLELGSVATPFEFRSIGTELALCQRYFSVVSGFSGYGYFAGGSASLITTVPLPVTMRAAPTVTITSSGSLTAGFSTTVYGAAGLSAFSYQVISNAAGTGGSLLASATAAIEL